MSYVNATGLGAPTPALRVRPGTRAIRVPRLRRPVGIGQTWSAGGSTYAECGPCSSFGLPGAGECAFSMQTGQWGPVASCGGQSITLQNLSRPGQPFQVGDQYQVSITSSPGLPIKGSWPVAPALSVPNVPSDYLNQNLGNTDSSGNWSMTGTVTTPGTFHFNFSVGGLTLVDTMMTVTGGPSATTPTPTPSNVQVVTEGGGTTTTVPSSSSSSSIPSSTTPTPAAGSCFSLLSQFGIPDPCLGPIGLTTLGAGVLALFLVASMFGEHKR
jgi:hypothetical protein